MAAKKTRRNPEPDFDDEDSVRAVMARELDADPEDLDLDEGGKGFSSFGVDSFWLVELGKRSWVVARDQDALRDLALAVVTQDLEETPEMFGQDFLESHINVDRLRRDLHADEVNSNTEYFNDMRDRELLAEANRYGCDADAYIEEDEDGDEELDRDGLIEELAEAKATKDLKHPVDYLTDVMGQEEGLATAIKIAGIDVKAAAEEAVDSDGPEHYIGSYDGHSHELHCGWVYWRMD